MQCLLKGPGPLASPGRGSTSVLRHQNRSPRTRDGGRQAIQRTRGLGAGLRRERSGIEPVRMLMGSRGNELERALGRRLEPPPRLPTQARVVLSREERKRSRLTVACPRCRAGAAWDLFRDNAGGGVAPSLESGPNPALPSVLPPECPTPSRVQTGADL